MFVKFLFAGRGAGGGGGTTTGGTRILAGIRVVDTSLSVISLIADN